MAFLKPIVDIIAEDARKLAKENDIQGAGVNSIEHSKVSADYSYDYGKALATFAGGSKEFLTPSNGRNDTYKDLFNNEVGRRITEFAKLNNLPKSFLDSLIIDAYRNGELIIEENDLRILNNESPTWTYPSDDWTDNNSDLPLIPPPIPIPPPELPIPLPEPLRFPTPIVPQSPIVLDLNGNNTIDHLNLDESPAYFDLYNNEFAVHTSWITGGDGFLVYDRNNDGIINNRNELFGADAEVGAYEKLAEFDSNNDAVIDANDAQFSNLLVWVDSNLDGYSHPWELFSLSELEIATIGLEVNLVPEDNQQLGDSLITETSYFVFEDGTTKQTADIFFNNNPVNSLFLGDYELNEAVLDIPYIRGYGLLPDLYIAASLDSSLLQTTEELLELNPSDVFAINLKLDRFLYQWSGSLSRNPRNSFRRVDERKLGFLEQVSVQDNQLAEDRILFVGAASGVNLLYDNAKAEFAKGFFINEIYANQFTGFEFNPFSGEVFANAEELDNAITALEAIEPSTPSEQALFWTLLAPTLFSAQESAGLVDFDARVASVIEGSGLTLDDLKNPHYSVIFDESVLTSIDGNEGDEIIINTDGDKYISPGGGSDLIYWGNGDGNDTLNEFGFEGDVDTVYIEFDFTKADLTPAGQNLLITNTVTDETLTVLNFFQVPEGDNRNSVEAVNFTDRSYTNGELIAELNTPDADNNILTGSNSDDELTLSGGNDIANGYTGSDRYNVYADGNHTINDLAGNNVAFTDTAYIYGVNPDEVTVTSSSSDIVLNFGFDSSLTLESQLLDNGIGKIEEVKFINDPDTIWTASDLQNMVL